MEVQCLLKIGILAKDKFDESDFQALDQIKEQDVGKAEIGRHDQLRARQVAQDALKLDTCKFFSRNKIQMFHLKNAIKVAKMPCCTFP
jgi:hypothetical protein